LLDSSIEGSTTTNQVPVVNCDSTICRSAILPAQNRDALSGTVSLQRHKLEVVLVAPVEQVACFWFVLHCFPFVVCILPDTPLVVNPY
jgi:hypothetical protein